MRLACAPNSIQSLGQSLAQLAQRSRQSVTQSVRRQPAQPSSAQPSPANRQQASPARQPRPSHPTQRASDRPTISATLLHTHIFRRHRLHHLLLPSLPFPLSVSTNFVTALLPLLSARSGRGDLVLHQAIAQLSTCLAIVLSVLRLALSRARVLGSNAVSHDSKLLIRAASSPPRPWVSPAPKPYFRRCPFSFLRTTQSPLIPSVITIAHHDGP